MADQLPTNEAEVNPLAEMEREVTALRQQLAAFRHGLPEGMAARLRGSSVEELDADAQSLARLLTGGLSPAPRIPAANSADPTPRPSEADRIRERIDGGRSPFFDPAFHIAKGGGPQDGNE